MEKHDEAGHGTCEMVVGQDVGTSIQAVRGSKFQECITVEKTTTQSIFTKLATSTSITDSTVITEAIIIQQHKMVQDG